MEIHWIARNRFSRITTLWLLPQKLRSNVFSFIRRANAACLSWALFDHWCRVLAANLHRSWRVWTTFRRFQCPSSSLDSPQDLVQFLFFFFTKCKPSLPTVHGFLNLWFTNKRIKVSATLKITIFPYLRFQLFQIDMLESFLLKKNQKKILFLSKDIGGKRFFLVNYLNWSLTRSVIPVSYIN